MARRTANSLFYVNAVIKVGVIRQVVHSLPFDGFASAETRADRFKIWTLGPDLFMAVHARRGRRHSRGCGCFDGRVTVTAVDAVVADVVFMTELNWLLPFDPLTRIP